MYKGKWILTSSQLCFIHCLFSPVLTSIVNKLVAIHILKTFNKTANEKQQNQFRHKKWSNNDYVRGKNNGYIQFEITYIKNVYTVKCKTF